MMETNRGTHEGDLQEIEFVKDFNKNKTCDKFKDYTSQFKNKLENIYMVRVSTNQISHLNGKKTKTRADCFAIFCEDEKIKNLLEENDFYLNEQLIADLKFSPIKFSGVSIKLEDSEKYQILKIGTNSFCSLFGNFELGAGASLFCSREEELIKNKDVVKGWNTTLSKMKVYFEIIEDEHDLITKKEVCQKVKTFCNNKIKELIDSSVQLKQKVFNGYPLYEEPYTAWFLFSKGKLKVLREIPFVVTTGSGRSHGDYTIVLKPKKES